MTIPQIKGFMEAIIRRTAMHSASFLSNTAVAAQGDSKSIKKAIGNYIERKDSLSKAKTVKRLTEAP
jgi:hypothetical protein